MAASAEFVTQITRVQRQLHAFMLSMVWNPVESDDVLQDAVRSMAGHGVAQAAAETAARAR